LDLLDEADELDDEELDAVEADVLAELDESLLPDESLLADEDSLDFDSVFEPPLSLAPTVDEEPAPARESVR
jgi:hypothetical protein